MPKHQGIVYWSDRDGCYVGLSGSRVARAH
jgi:hypothetical protein